MSSRLLSLLYEEFKEWSKFAPKVIQYNIKFLTSLVNSTINQKLICLFFSLDACKVSGGELKNEGFLFVVLRQFCLLFESSN